MSEIGYELLDFGQGRKLECVDGVRLDRPSPPAEPFEMRLPPSEWSRVHGQFRRSDGLRGSWRWKAERPRKVWALKTAHFSLELKPTEVGHLGIFPEQAPNWEWIYEQTKFFLERRSAFRVLNLFAYTGGSTLASAAAMSAAGKTSDDAERFFTAHVDSAKNIVQWARANAELSGLTGAPIRWIGEDAVRFVQRELKRGRTYDAVILDPPSYGHGTRGEVWKLEQNLPELLDLCAELIAASPAFVLLTAHSPGLDARELERILRQHFPRGGESEAYPMELRTKSGRILPSGMAARMAW